MPGAQWQARVGCQRHLDRVHTSLRPAIPASAVGYTAGVITKVGTATYALNNAANLTRRRRGSGP
jgi:hypothetical protein